MALLSHFFISDAEEAVRYPEKQLARSDVAAFNGLTVQEVSELWAAAQDQAWTNEHLTAFDNVREVRGGEVLVHRLPSAFVEALAQLDSISAQAVAERWVKIGELAYLSISPEDVRPVIDAVSRLAQKVEFASGRTLYFWMSL